MEKVFTKKSTTKDWDPFFSLKRLLNKGGLTGLWCSSNFSRICIRNVLKRAVASTTNCWWGNLLLKRGCGLGFGDIRFLMEHPFVINTLPDSYFLSKIIITSSSYILLKKDTLDNTFRMAYQQQKVLNSRIYIFARHIICCL